MCITRVFMKSFFKVRIFAVISLILTLVGATAPCAALPTAPAGIKKLLILNSYDESELWANDMAETVATYISSVRTVGCDILNMDNAMIYNREEFDRMSDYIFKLYADNPPSYVVMVGNFAFTLRARIQQEWGDIPILLISKILNVNSVESNFASDTSEVRLKDGLPLLSLRPRYNFTTIYAPSYYVETVDLMLSMIPDMREFVFFSTNVYVSRAIADGIEQHLAVKYPNVSFRWLKASPENFEEFQNYLVNPHPQTGLLMSNWVYEKMSAREVMLPSGNDIRLMASSKTPIFSLRESYRTLGAIGGVFNDEEQMKREIESSLKKMIAGVPARDIPFYFPDTKTVKINYRLLKEYGIPEANCPEDTEFLVKPLNYWEKYKWQTIVALLLFFIILGITLAKLLEQKRSIARLNYNKLFLSNMPLPFTQARVIYDKMGKVMNISYTTQNHAFEELIEKNAIPGNEYLLFPAEFIAAKTEELLNTRKNVEFSYYFKHTDSYYYFTLALVSVKIAAGSDTISVIDIFARDVTLTSRSRVKLQTYAAKLDLTLRVANIIPWRWNIMDGTIIFDDRGLFDPKFRSKFRPGDEEERVVRFSDFLRRVYPEDIHLVEEGRANFLAGVKSQVQQIRIYRQMGDPTVDWVEINAAVTSSNEGSEIMVSGSLHVITEKKRQDEEMALALERAKEADRMKSTFLANMSHEIRTPLNAIVGFSNLLVDIDDQNERREFADIINLNNDLLLALVGDVLDLAKIEANTLDLHYSVTDINEILLKVQQSVSLRLEKGVELNVKIGQEHCIAEVEPIRLSQVIMNLTTNASKFTSEGSITVGYEIHGEKTLYFYVKDTGIGIDPEKKDTVFDRFVKLNAFKQGTGLGLSICRRLVEMMGGQIGVESEGIGHGSCFWFTLPYKPAVDGPEGVDGFEEIEGVGAPSVPAADVAPATPPAAASADAGLRAEGAAGAAPSVSAASAAGAAPSAPAADASVGAATAVPAADASAGAVDASVGAVAASAADVSAGSVDVSVGAAPSAPAASAAGSVAASAADVSAGAVDAAPSVSAASVVGERPLVLVAEDDDSNYKLASYLLGPYFRLMRAVNGLDAVEKFSEIRPSLIVMDINMPVMDGYEAVARIRQIDKHVPIIALTAYAYSSDRDRIMRSGFNEYVTKPVSLTALLDAINKVNSRRGGVKLTVK